jgi:Asp/Glu/hydantoin racemase
MDKRPKIALIHTIHQIIPHLQCLFTQLVPEADAIHLLDETILPEVIQTGSLTARANQKVFQMVKNAEEAGVLAVLITCSSISPCAAEVSKMVSIPVLKIDEPMAREASFKGRHIAILATLNTTLAPTIELIQLEAEKSRKIIDIRSFLCTGAYKALQEGDLRTHDQIIQSHIEEAASWADVLIFAQASMAKVIERTQITVNKETLTSPYSGISQVSKLLEEMHSLDKSK